jgi:hypothetical protein
MTQKFLLALALCSFLNSTLHAQINKGALWLGGNISYYKDKQEYESIVPATTTRELGIRPAIGKAIKDNTILGADLEYYNYKNVVPYSVGSTLTTQETKRHAYGAGIFVRRYMPIVKRLYLFGQARASFTSTTETRIVSYPGAASSKTNYWNTGISIYPGISVALNNKLHLESGLANLFYAQYSHGKADNGKSNGFSTSLSLDTKSSFYVGFRLLINNKS